MRAKTQEERQKKRLSRFDITNLQDAYIAAGVIVLVEKFKFGKEAHADVVPKVQRFVRGSEKQISYFCYTFDEDAREGIRGRLKSYGFDYPLSSEKWLRSQQYAIIRDVMVMSMLLCLIEEFEFGAIKQADKTLRIEVFRDAVTDIIKPHKLSDYRAKSEELHRYLIQQHRIFLCDKGDA